jgi:hypothetical protein
MSTATNTKKVDLAGITTQIHGLLDGLEPAERQRAITAALTLLGDTYVFPAVGQAMAAPAAPSLSAHRGHQASDAVMTPRDFFASKDPKNKVEELAVAARYRELHEGAEGHTKEQLAQVIKAARRNFDATNFSRDLGNAKTSKLFSLGKDNALSYTGQQFVDALPDRDQALGLRKGKMAKRGKAGKAKA